MQAFSSFAHSSLLVGQLAKLWPPDSVPGQPDLDVAQTLGGWLGLADTIRLHAQATARPPEGSAGLLGFADDRAVRLELERVQAQLARAITAAAATKSSAAKPEDLDAELALFQMRLAELQTRMETPIRKLRARVREHLRQSSANLAALASLDTLMEEVFGLREQRLLTLTLPFVKARFMAMKQAAKPDANANTNTNTNTNARADRQAAARPQSQPEAGPNAGTDLSWLNLFSKEFEQILLAELDLRLQPVVGLIEALEHER